MSSKVGLFKEGAQGFSIQVNIPREHQQQMVEVTGKLCSSLSTPVLCPPLQCTTTCSQECPRGSTRLSTPCSWAVDMRTTSSLPIRSSCRMAACTIHPACLLVTAYSIKPSLTHIVIRYSGGGIPCRRIVWLLILDMTQLLIGMFISYLLFCLVPRQRQSGSLLPNWLQLRRIH